MIVRHEHSLHRRATLLKQNVIHNYEQQAKCLEANREEIATSMVCIISLKEYHEENMGRGYYKEVDQAIDEIGEVHENISKKIGHKRIHIVLEDKHGEDKFRAATQGLGRVRVQLE